MGDDGRLAVGMLAVLGGLLLIAGALLVVAPPLLGALGLWARSASGEAGPLGGQDAALYGAVRALLTHPWVVPLGLGSMCLGAGLLALSAWRGRNDDMGDPPGA